MRKGRLKGRSGQPALTFFPTASVGPSVLSTCISKPGPSGRPIRKKSPVDSLIDPLLTLTSWPPIVAPPRPLSIHPPRNPLDIPTPPNGGGSGTTPPRLICSDPHRCRVDCALSLNGSKSGSTPTGLSCDVREKGRGKHEPDTLRGASCPSSAEIQARRPLKTAEKAACTGRPGKTTERSSGCAQPLIQVLWARPEHGLDPVELACADALRPGACNASVSLTASTPAHTPLRCFRATPADPPTGAFTSRTGPCCMTHRRTMASTWLYRHGAILRGIQALAS